MQKNKHRQILKQIRRIRESHPAMVKIFTNGSCLDFFLILRAFYPEAEMRIDNDHVVTKIGDRLYDITGEVIGEYFPTEQHLVTTARKKVVKELRSERALLKETFANIW